MTFGQHIADMVASFVGSWMNFFLHTIWFALWFLFRLDVALLTNIVSLEAIYLCILLLKSQNRQAAKDHLAAEADYHTNLQAKEEIETLLARIEAQDKEMLSQHLEMLKQTPLLEEIHKIMQEQKPVQKTIVVPLKKGSR
jgi:uncharacterized membrane protein